MTAFLVERYTSTLRRRGSATALVEASDPFEAVKLVAHRYGDPHRIVFERRTHGARIYASKAWGGHPVWFAVQEESRAH